MPIWGALAQPRAAWRVNEGPEKGPIKAVEAENPPAAGFRHKSCTLPVIGTVALEGARTWAWLAGPAEKKTPGTLLRRSALHYGVVALTYGAVSLVNLWVLPWIGYQAVALVYLLAVALLALVVGRGPILCGASLTALGWGYCFIPPRYSFHVSNPYDKMMLAMYFIVALIIGQLTARLRAERGTEINTRSLAESERLGRTLLNSVSHELRTPIATIMGAASSLPASGPLTPVQQKLATEIDLAAGRLNRVVQSLLSAARLQSGQLRPQLDWFDVSEAVQSTLRQNAAFLASHPVVVRLTPHLPLVRADAALMEQALSNLLLNAALHTPPNTPIEVCAAVQADTLELEVADRGPGLAPAHLERLFDWFYRPPTAGPGGIGLGLGIVKGFVEAQGGRVWAANRPEGGALFRISLPVGTPPALEEELA